MFVHDGLDLGILGGVDPEASAVEKGIRLIICQGIAVVKALVHDQVFILEVAQDLADQGIDKVGVDPVVYLFLILVDVLDLGVDVFFQGFFVFFFSDKALIVHMLEDDLLALVVVLRKYDRVIGAGILGYGGEDCAFRQSQVGSVLVKIALGGRLHAQGIMAQVDRVEVVEQDLGLVHVFFKLIGEILFLNLALDPVLSCLICPVCEDIVLDQLLRDRAGAFGKVEPACQPDIGGTENARDVDPAVLVETLVLDGDKGIGKIVRDPRLIDRDPVGICGDESGDLSAFVVIDKSGIALGADIDRADIGRGLENAPVCPVHGADTDNASTRDHDHDEREHQDPQPGKTLAGDTAEGLFSGRY